MTIPRKGSRRLTVDGVPYRWSVRPRPTYSQGIGQSPLSFAVVNDHAPGSTLVVTLDAMRPDNWLQEPSAVVTPNMVELAIRKALSEGWHAQQGGGAFALQFSVATR
jgi:hypothetical protein